MPDKKQNVEFSILDEIYGREAYPSVRDSVSIVKPGDATTPGLEEAVRRFPLACLPMLQDNQIGEWGRRSRLLHIILSFLTCAISNTTYREISDVDVPRTLELINQIAEESAWTLPFKAFLIHSLMAFVLAYRDHRYIRQHNSIIWMPVWNQGAVSLKECRLDQEIELCQGAVARLFVPVDAEGSPTCLFHGTVFWGEAKGITITDDFNPFGVGYEIRMAAKQALKRVLSQYPQKAIVIGQSLGGILATGLAVDLPDLVDTAVAFGCPRPSLTMVKEWEQVCFQPSAPRIYTFFGSFAGRVDPVILIGGMWIGRVFTVDYVQKRDPISRHTTILPLSLQMTIRELDVDVANTTGWLQTNRARFAQKVIASTLYSMLATLFGCSRLYYWSSDDQL